MNGVCERMTHWRTSWISTRQFCLKSRNPVFASPLSNSRRLEWKLSEKSRNAKLAQKRKHRTVRGRALSLPFIWKCNKSKYPHNLWGLLCVIPYPPIDYNGTWAFNEITATKLLNISIWRPGRLMKKRTVGFLCVNIWAFLRQQHRLVSTATETGGVSMALGGGDGRSWRVSGSCERARSVVSPDWTTGFSFFLHRSLNKEKKNRQNADETDVATWQPQKKVWAKPKIPLLGIDLLDGEMLKYLATIHTPRQITLKKGEAGFQGNTVVSLDVSSVVPQQF